MFYTISSPAVSCRQTHSICLVMTEDSTPFPSPYLKRDDIAAQVMPLE